MPAQTTAKSLPPTADIREALALLNSGEWSETEFSAWDASRKSAPPAAKITLKTAYSGALSLYGLQRFPITLYAEQWQALLAHREQIEAHIAEDKPQHWPQQEKDGKVERVARTVRLKRHGQPEGAHVIDSTGSR